MGAIPSHGVGGIDAKRLTGGLGGPRKRLVSPHLSALGGDADGNGHREEEWTLLLLLLLLLLLGLRHSSFVGCVFVCESE